ncbi:MAG: DEAD/DEAH box helicase [Eubacterium sp.]|nr:DEAD/DEAH box helicase [Eubacterium sp.]
MEQILDLFEKQTKDWFQEALGEPTPVQKEAWHRIAAGEHVLVSAPTGTGKTLSAFLVFLDQMMRQAQTGELKQELQLIYVSPLKSLAADIRENLKTPLEGIRAEGMITTGIRTGDTPQRDRQRMVRKPPHILIITPESLYLMLTSRTGRKVLATARAVILDELHALIDTKRGAHLMLSLARLDRLCRRPLQRIGLSATIEPLELAAQYLAPEKAQIAAPVMVKKVRLEILSPFADATKGKRKDPVWEELGKVVYRYCQGSRSVIAFVEGRRYAEKLAYYVNLLGGENFARVHHGSLSKEQRLETELALREGGLRLLCATSSMELGIDVGEIDQVLQVGCPRTVSGTMQRLGRAGHNPGRVSVMYLFPRTAAECVLCGMTAQLAREGGVEQLHPPVGCLDVLAQHLVSMAAFGSYEVDEVMEILPRAWPFRGITKQEVKAVLEMLAGDYEHAQDIPARPRVLYDRIHEKVEGDGYSRMLAISAGGTIPDKGLYAVKTEDGVKLGEVDEEFVYETQKGDRFILGSFAWRVTQISRDTVTVVQAPVEGARLPFWKGEMKGRDKRTGEAFGRMLHTLQQAHADGMLEEALERLGLDASAVKLAYGYLARQIRAVGSLADDRTILVEHFRDSSGSSQLMFHSVFGRRINAPLALLTAHMIREEMGLEVGSVDEEDGFLVYAYGDQPLPEGALYRLNPDTCIKKLEILLPETPVFNMAFRYNSARALMMGVKRNGRQPLWAQRLKSAQLLEQVVREKEHPLIQETRRECMQELWDGEGLRQLLSDIQAGVVQIREVYVDVPSPMSLPLQWSQEAAVMYDYAPTPGGIHAAVREALEEEQRQGTQLVLPSNEELRQVQEAYGKLPEDAKQLHTLLMTQGDLAAGDLDIPVEWLDELALDGRALYLEQGLWIATEQEAEYAQALSGSQGQGVQPSQLHIVRRMLRYRGAADACQVAQRYGWTVALAEEILQALCQQKEAVQHDKLYYHAVLYQRARVRTLKSRREEAKTCPPQAYAAMLLARMESGAPAQECLEHTLKQYAGASFPAASWESIVLPARVAHYRDTMLDAFLAEGELFWHMDAKGGLCFEFQEEADWDADVSGRLEELEKAGADKEARIYEALLKRGASFMQPLNRLLNGESAHEPLLSLMARGYVYADSFVPVRQWIELERSKKMAPKRLASMRVKALRAGRWDVVRPVREQALKAQMIQKLERCFDRSIILCRETAAAWGISWQEALSVLRVWEYTGQARRGYFAEGMSGAQFVRGKDAAAVMRMLQNPAEKLVWVNATDPAQSWGNILPHLPGRSFMRVPGTAAACCGGAVVAVMERQGKLLRLFAPELAGECMKAFARQYQAGEVFAGRKRIVVKDYPIAAQDALAQAGFHREMQDYVLYQES